MTSFSNKKLCRFTLGLILASGTGLINAIDQVKTCPVGKYLTAGTCHRKFKIAVNDFSLPKTV
jgi:hypothetical protein